MLTFHKTALGRLLVIYWLPDGRMVSHYPAVTGATRCYFIPGWGGVVSARLYKQLRAFLRFTG